MSSPLEALLASIRKRSKSAIWSQGVTLARAGAVALESRGSDESVLRVLYAYLMHCSTMDIPKLKFPRDEIIEIIPAAYQNEAKRIHIPGLDPKLVPGSPEDIRIPVPPGPGGDSGTLSPIPGLSSPAEPAEPALQRPPERVVNKAAEMDDKVFEKERTSLEKSARELANKVGPTDVVRHYLERAMAEVLSNPHLPAAIEKRLKAK